MTTVAPYGAWRSPITSALLVEQTVRLSNLVVDGDTIYWNELRPAEGGRQVIVRRLPDGATEDVLPEGFSARTLVHEYGGLCYAVRNGVVWFSNFADQRQLVFALLVLAGIAIRLAIFGDGKYGVAARQMREQRAVEIA